MRWLLSAAGAAALVSSAFGQVDSTSVKDADSGLTFSQYVNDKGMAFRVAVPDKASGAAYSIVTQIIAPITTGWVGIAWGGSMTYNPLAIVWLNGKTPVVSSRMAYSYQVPPVYPDATYKVLSKAAHVNATHFQATAQCTGCSTWGDQDTGITTLDIKGQNALAFAHSANPPQDPSKLDSSFNMHDVIGHWVHDFSQGQNANLDAAIAKLA